MNICFYCKINYLCFYYKINVFIAKINICFYCKNESHTHMYGTHLILSHWNWSLVHCLAARSKHNKIRVMDTWLCIVCIIVWCTPWLWLVHYRTWQYSMHYCMMYTMVMASTLPYMTVQYALLVVYVLTTTRVQIIHECILYTVIYDNVQTTTRVYSIQ
jgi:hypothetical protein